MTDSEIEVKVATLEANQKTIFHNMDEMKEEIRDIRRLTVAVEKIATKTDDIAEKVHGIDARLDTVERAPGKAFTHYKQVIAGSVITGVIGIIIGALFALIIK